MDTGSAVLLLVWFGTLVVAVFAILADWVPKLIAYTKRVVAENFKPDSGARF